MSKDELSTKNIPLEVERKIATAIAMKKDLDQLEKDIKAQLKEAMEKHNIYSIKNDRFTITLANRTTYKAKDVVPINFAKAVLDSSKVSAYETLNGELPEGVEKSESKYITWRAK